MPARKGVASTHCVFSRLLSLRSTEFALEDDLHVQVPAAVLLQVLAHDARDVLREALCGALLPLHADARVRPCPGARVGV